MRSIQKTLCVHFGFFCVANSVKICDRFYINIKYDFLLYTSKLEAYGRLWRLKMGAGEWRGRRHEAALIVGRILVEAGKPTGAFSGTGWRWRMTVDPVAVLGSG
jgi:hypothetical protein